MFRRIAIVNRGEPAVRLVRAVRELDEERGSRTQVIALHTEAERGATFVRLADEAVLLEPTGAAVTPYLDHAALAAALRRSRADAAWVGWGFVAEDAAFAELCASLGVVFIGPSPEAMRRLGDKVEAKLLAERVAVPVAAWSGGPVTSLEHARESAAAIGFPLIVKARSGGGGRGIRRVLAPEGLDEAVERCQEEALRSFGDPVVFLERLVGGGRHVEVQVIADAHGTVWPVGVRDCSVQRRNQKLIEESSSPALSEAQKAHLKAVSADLVRASAYCGAGTVEFLYETATEGFAFLEVNTRLQVEHPVTELTTGLDLVKLQILVAEGEPLVGEPPPELGYAVEARLNAEDPDRDFAPAPGRVELLRLPGGPGVRVDTGLSAGDVIPPEYDSMVAKVIGFGRDRVEALARLRRALRETTVAVRGGTTNKSFLLDLLGRPEVLEGTADTGWLDRSGASVLQAPPLADVAMITVAVDVYDDAEAAERAQFLASARGGRPRARHAAGREVELRYRGAPYRLEVAQVGPATYRVTAAGGTVHVEVEQLGPFERRVAVGGRRHRVVSVRGLADVVVEVDGFAHRVARDEGGVVRASSPAVVVALRVAPGDEVEVGEPLVVLESMKMETVVTAPTAGRVREVLVAANAQVDGGAPLLRLEAEAGGEAAVASGHAVEFPVRSQVSPDPRARALAALAGLRALVTGYDVSVERGRELARELGRVRKLVRADDPGLTAEGLDVLRVFADLCELSRNRPAREEEAAERVHSPREYFHAYLRTLDAERAGLPEAFRVRLARALASYGLHDLEPGPELEEAVYRVFLALERMPSLVPLVAVLLERWLSERLVAGGGESDEALRDVLDRLIAATQLRFPVLGDLARSLRFQLFDLPATTAAREAVYAGVREHLDHLARHLDAPDYAEHIAALVASPEPLMRFLTERIGRGGAEREPMLEVVARRYYKLRGLEDIRSTHRDGRPVVRAEYELDGERLQLVSTLADRSELAEAARAVAAVAGEARDSAGDGGGGGGGGAGLVADFYLAWEEPPGDADAMAAELRDTLAAVAFPVGVRRVTVVVSSRGGAARRTFTFRPDESGELAEARVIRDLHPLIAHRLDFWRLRNFDVTRLPAPEDVYLFRCVAPGNPDDERLVALAEIRDVAVLRDARGRVTALPAVERLLASCVDAIRRTRAASPRGQQLDANRVFLYAWPPTDASAAELAQAARVLAPLTAGAGLEEIMVLGRVLEPGEEAPREVALRAGYAPGAGLRLEVTEPPVEPLAPLDAYQQKVRRAAARGAVHPYELVPMIIGPAGYFEEHDLDDSGRLVPVDRPRGENTAGIVVGIVRTPTDRYPEGMTRVVLLGDATKSLGSVAEPECARVVAALDLAASLGAPLEWFALSSGARISMDSGTENMDWVARALRRIIEFTQAGGEVNVVVAGINVGAQPYWNAEATMLLHTRGILVMTPDSAMVLTGKQSLDYSGGVSAEDNFGIGGYDRVMGPNGQAQYWAPNLAAACDVLFAHYEATYVAPGERYPRRAVTTDPVDRDVRDTPHRHPASDFRTVGDIFSEATNPERKKPFDIRTLMRAVADADRPPRERWAGMAEADTAVVFDAYLGGIPVALLGFESRTVPRLGRPPTDGPDVQTAGTLFPRSSKKTARAINAASGNRPLVVLANLSGFDGSPESLRNLQLEHGAEIGRAVTNFDGPIVFCVVSRYHGGAFVVFSGALNDRMEVVAVEGSYASVIGGAPAAAVVFAGEVRRRVEDDPQVAALQARLSRAGDADAPHLRVELEGLRARVQSEKLGEVAAEFDAVHSIERARRVGSVHTIIPAARLRPYLVEAVERGMARDGVLESD